MLSEGRLPTTMALSLMLHVGAAAAWMRMQATAPAAPVRVIGDVDLLIKTRPQPGVIAAPVKTPPSTWNFLRMALPSIPKIAEPLDIHTPESIHKSLVDVPQRLADRGRLKEAAKLEGLDLGRRHAAARLDDGALEAETRHHVVADLPKLEEVGVRRAPRKVLQMAAALEDRQGSLQEKPLDALSQSPSLRSHAAPADAPLLPEEAAPSHKPGMLDKMANMLGSEPPPLQLQARAAPEPKQNLDALSPTLPKKKETALGEAKKKAMEIEGPIASRRLVSYELPAFPEWLSAQGVVEAEVRIKFYVDPSGDVMPDMQVETTSGYARLDRLAMESLKTWKFEPAPAEGRQWGIITFRFLAE